MQLHGAWHDALSEAQSACEPSSSPSPRAPMGAALYQRGEIHRLRGEFAAAEESYRQASQCGRNPHPGLALLRLAQGQADVACAAIRRAAEETRDRSVRSRMLAACVEIELAVGDSVAARTAAEELAKLAAELRAPMLCAMSNQAMGAVSLFDGQPSAALASLREAWAAWRELEAPYESARVGVLIALACRALGDVDTGAIELDSARQVFQRLGAVPDLARLEEVWREPEAKPVDGLTAREVEVLRLVATGQTNRAIAAALFISEKTVARHVSNIFTKLGLTSRAAATAYAYQRSLV
jgi:DNA-binding CsgD family transcriptional regulator